MMCMSPMGVRGTQKNPIHGEGMKVALRIAQKKLIWDHGRSKFFPFTPKSRSVNKNYLIKFKEHLVHISAQLFLFVNFLWSL